MNSLEANDIPKRTKIPRICQSAHCQRGTKWYVRIGERMIRWLCTEHKKECEPRAAMAIEVPIGIWDMETQ